MRGDKFLKFFVLGLVLSSFFVATFACEDEDHVEPTDAEKAGTDSVDYEHKTEEQHYVVPDDFVPEEAGEMAFGKPRIRCADELTCAIQQIEDTEAIRNAVHRFFRLIDKWVDIETIKSQNKQVDDVPDPFFQDFCKHVVDEVAILLELRPWGRHWGCRALVDDFFNTFVKANFIFIRHHITTDIIEVDSANGVGTMQFYALITATTRRHQAVWGQVTFDSKVKLFENPDGTSSWKVQEVIGDYAFASKFEESWAKHPFPKNVIIKTWE